MIEAELAVRQVATCPGGNYEGLARHLSGGTSTHDLSPRQDRTFIIAMILLAMLRHKNTS